MPYDVPLSWLTRRIASLRGAERIIVPLRRHYTHVYRDRPDSWTTIRDFDGDLAFHLDRAAYMGSLIYWRGAHEVPELALLRALLRPDMVFADVGANQGEFTLVATKRLTAGRVFAFEPVPRMRESLARNVALNGFTNVTIVDVGLADAAERRPFYVPEEQDAIDGYNEGLASLYPRGPGLKKAGEISVDSLDRLATELHLDRLDVMKIDVEGAEWPALIGAHETLHRLHPVIFLELNAKAFAAAGYTVVDLLGWLAKQGYTTRLIGPGSTQAQTDPSRLPSFCNVICQPS